ncbi:hypothetical protein [Mycobacteroides abscessus]|uniref:hypothetical protein n=1 Tax=Mycobacteroides abscessus TaxID=36809 RepID=UPI00092B056D|nr:hypothetical protein [Mycobacteroides abscessus]SHQ50896.1 Uncharacterised protein [Mycobacteroides abscessus subsp. abscessus]SKQ83003.1 Uncharacterised protein [Mycobacteroides abscessus subsp. massiliense]SLC50066.1 Uncharacterised protein [Mycobacteroides abscessus subsp. massiliense]
MGDSVIHQECKSDTIEVRVNGVPLTEFIVNRLSIQITRREVLIRGECTDTQADKVLLNDEALESLGYSPDLSSLPPVNLPWLKRLAEGLRAFATKVDGW